MVVDLPCVPAIATPNRSSITWPEQLGIFDGLADRIARRPGIPRWNLCTAAVRTTRSISRDQQLAHLVAGDLARRARASSSVCALGFGSEPLTIAPLSRSMRASPLIPQPPMPIK